MVQVKRITTKDDVQLVTKELQSKRWETLEHDANETALTTFLKSAHNYLLLAYEASKVVGMLTAHRLDKLDARKCEFLLYEIEVKDEYRGKGIGKTLIGSLKAYAIAEGASEVWVLTELDNEPAQRLYSGFTTIEPSSELVYKIEL